MERFLITKESDIGVAVVSVQTRARQLGFSESQIDRLATAVSELARNIMKYSAESGGDILLSEKRDGSRLELLLQARDNGPGIANLQEALSEHYSSSGTLGLGLPGVKRMMDHFSIISVPGSGTVITISLAK